MDIKALPHLPNLGQYKKQAKDLVRDRKAGDPEAIRRMQQFHPRFQSVPEARLSAAGFSLTDAQLVIAGEHGFASWPSFAARIEAIRREHFSLLNTNPEAAFIEAACVPLNSSHQSGNLDDAGSILLKQPEVATRSIYTAAILGDDLTVRHLLALNPDSATAKGGIRNWDALTYLCFSRYLRLDPARSNGMVESARALLDAGASANTGWFEPLHQPHPMWESAIYGAAGVAHHAELTHLLLERGADPNDDETPYHAAEGYDQSALKVLVESGKLNEGSLTTILLRKADWHDFEGIKYLLAHGADPNRMTRWHHNVLHHALQRDNEITIIDALLDHGADPALVNGRDGRSATAMAAHRGRGDVIYSIERRAIPTELRGIDRLIAACAKGDTPTGDSISEQESQLVAEIIAQGGTLLAEFAGNGNVEGVRRLLDLGVDVAARYKQGDAYFDIAKDSTALHLAAWRMRHSVVKLLVARQAPVDALDGEGRTALALAVRACVDSYWADRRSPESVRLLLDAGASARAVEYPSGYLEVDQLLSQYRPGV